MATPLLADAHGQYLPRLVQHDLESFFWTTLFGLVNFSGPFQQVKDWSKVAGGSTGGQNHSVNTMIVPPVEFPQSQARASEVIPTQVLQGTH